jgi:hypothetical protein
VHARDGALRRLTALNRLAAAGAAALVFGFTALAAKATPPKHHTAAATVTRSTTPTAHARTAGGDATDAAPAQRSDQAAPAPTPAPAPTTQAPVVTSGGS